MKTLKYTLLLSFFIVSTSINSQETDFKVTKDKITDYLITNCDSASTEEMYTKTLEWISRTFVNKDEVLQSQIKNEMIRLEGHSENINGKTLNANYVIEIAFKNDRYKFDPIKLSLSNDNINKFDFFETYSNYFKKDGTIKPRLKDTVDGVERLFNRLNSSLHDYIMNKNEKKDDW